MTVCDQPGIRASDGDRDAALAALRDAFVRGRISHATLVHRLDAVLVARTHRDLGFVLADLTEFSPHRPPRWLWWLVTSLSRVVHGVRAAWRAPTLPPLVLPAGLDDRLIGRSEQADYVVRQESVSRRHASFCRGRDGWLVFDLGSTNGTYVNGWRVGAPLSVKEGDVVTFGAVSFAIVTAPKPQRVD